MRIHKDRRCNRVAERGKELWVMWFPGYVLAYLDDFALFGLLDKAFRLQHGVRLE